MIRSRTTDGAFRYLCATWPDPTISWTSRASARATDGRWAQSLAAMTPVRCRASRRASFASANGFRRDPERLRRSGQGRVQDDVRGDPEGAFVVVALAVEALV